MPEVTELLERLADRPPWEPAPVGAIRARARRRRQRRQRRSTVALGLAAIVAVVAGFVVVRDGGEGDVEVRTTPTSSPPNGPTLTESIGPLSLNPSSGLRDGDTIELTYFRDPGGELVATQCAAEVLEFTDQEPGDVAGIPTDWCGTVFHLRSPAGRPDLTMEVTRIQRSPAGDVDCASAPGRCVVMEGPGFVGRHFAPLVFAEGLPPVADPTLRLERPGDDLADGEVVRVVGSHFPASAGEVQLVQCVGRADEVLDGTSDPCDVARSTWVPVADDGTFTTEVRVFRDVVTSDSLSGPGPWTACEPCLLVAGDARLPLDVTATDEPVHPTMRITSPGPYQPGERVQIEGEGFQAGQEVAISWCPGETRDICQFAGQGSVTADAGGRFLVDDFPLPGTGPLSASCPTRPGACVLTWAPALEGIPSLISIPLDLSG